MDPPPGNRPDMVRPWFQTPDILGGPPFEVVAACAAGPLSSFRDRPPIVLAFQSFTAALCAARLLPPALCAGVTGKDAS